ncbi:hemolysin family protein [Sphingomonas astaxanthinifaciens]|uniref:DNA-binding protein n=1 Tax=Sphingomonas astaxanthinifaciens DSM 22298 TaxID=1123267 RepID=A0ABQ5Z9P5_9SPHN|nr:hemolysin family protein [Sphingomonas astaxanthinifaciens]GLR48335.1 DNA-binding protein [Sphingomonas astaxanthinifaciens DSM 22298]
MSGTLLPFPWLDLVLILALIALNGVLSMSELAIVSAREARLKAMAKSGSSSAKVALTLAADPGRFLSTVQTGITLIGILAGAFSGSRLGTPVSQRIELLGVDAETATTVGFGLVIVLTTFASLVIGELVPKQFALRSPEPIAVVMARPMLWLSKATAPFVWLLDKTSGLIFRLLGMSRESQNQVTAEELHLVVAEAQTAGVLEESERAIISGIVRLADRPVREVMTPRTEVDWIDVSSTTEEIKAALAETPHSRIPVAEGSVEKIVGVVKTRDMLDALLDGRGLDLRALARKAPVIPDVMDAMDALTVLRSAEVPLALVHDEYGHLDGIVTPGSILAALAGTFANDAEDDDPPLVEREDGSWLVSGSANADLLEDKLGINLGADRDYSTVAGFALSVLKHLPETGECFDFDNWRFEVVDLDGRKIDKLLARRRSKREKVEA